MFNMFILVVNDILFTLFFCFVLFFYSYSFEDLYTVFIAIFIYDFCIVN